MAVKILGNQQNTDPEKTRWVSIQVCGRLPNQSSPSSGQSSAAPPRPSPNLATLDRDLKPGIKGFVKDADFSSVAVRLDPAKLGTLSFNGCSASVTAPTPTSPEPDSPNP
jgi:hypothetical protein